jgi:hypothetical protein
MHCYRVRWRPTDVAHPDMGHPGAERGGRCASCHADCWDIDGGHRERAAQALGVGHLNSSTRNLHDAERDLRSWSGRYKGLC